MGSDIAKLPSAAAPAVGKFLLLVVVPVAMATGAGLGFAGWSNRSSTLALWAELLLLASPALGVYATLPRRGRARAEEVITLSVAIERLQQADLSLRVIRGARAIALLALSYACVLWLCQSTGLISARTFVLYYSLISLAAVASYLPWLARREREMLGMRETLRDWLSAYKAGRNWSLE